MRALKYKRLVILKEIPLTLANLEFKKQKIKKSCAGRICSPLRDVNGSGCSIPDFSGYNSVDLQQELCHVLCTFLPISCLPIYNPNGELETFTGVYKDNF